MRKLLGVLLTAGLVLSVPAGPAFAVDDERSADTTPTVTLLEESLETLVPGPDTPVEPGPGGENTDPDLGVTDPGEVGPIPAPEQLPSVTGVAQVEQTLRGTPGLWLAPDLDFALQWQVDGSDVPGATGDTFPLLRDYAGKSVRLTVTASRAGADPLTVASEAVLVKPGTLRAGALKLSGTATVGQKLSVSAQASVPSGAALSYQWKRAGSAIAGATAASYTLVAADLGKQITVTVTSQLAGFTPAAASVGVGKAVAAGTLTTATPKISGAAVVGTTLKSSVGSWKPGGVALKYQWNRGGAAIPKATGSSYKLTSADAGKKITLSVTGTLAGYGTRTVTSAATGTVLWTLTAAPTPKISGTSKVGAKLTASAGAWKPAPVSLSYQWLRNGKAISGATKASYTLTKSDGGAKVSVRITGKKSGYVTVAKTSGTRSIPKVLSSPKPTISGSAVVGSKLTVKRGTWTKGTKLSTQWLRNGAAIRGATGSSYTVGSGDIGKRISVRVTGSQSGYSTAAQVSNATGVVKTPSRYNPGYSGTCPAWAPIKGNQTGKKWIYHVPGSTYYSRTVPEECFSTVAAAQAAGYRAPLR
ncbi:sunset domain-containing protein [Leucobacter chromiireducens]|uniref:sunset domain-containing protein n=1 Tax=Leucobacter chromiireducens TaxID=283877 RepID=UPI003F7DAE31